jgi:DNA-directed RNA polymerase specialized sigma24 family protein
MIDEEEAIALKSRVCVGKNADDAAKVWEAIAEGFTAQEVSELLEMSVSRVNELKKGIRRRLDGIEP